MIGVDTNVLVRYFARDDAAQARKVDAFVDGALDDDTKLHISDIVLCELVWVLRAAYRLGKPAITNVLEKVLATAAFSFDDRELLRAAVSDYIDGSGDFADYVIGRRNARSGCDHTVTLDRQLRGDSSFIVL